MVLRMRIFWEVVGFAWFALAVVLEGYLGVAGVLLAFLMWPLGWILWVNLQEHWPRREDRDSE
jgi:hypothetical protein